MDTRRREGKPAPLEQSITCFSYMGGGLLATFSPVGSLFCLFGGLSVIFFFFTLHWRYEKPYLKFIKGGFSLRVGGLCTSSHNKSFCRQTYAPPPPPPPLPHYLNIVYNIMPCCLLKPILAIVRGAK